MMAVSAFGAALPAAQKPIVWYIPADFCSIPGNSPALIQAAKDKLAQAGLVYGRDYSSVAADKHSNDVNSLDLTFQPLTAFASSVLSGAPFAKTFCPSTGVCASLTFVGGKPRAATCSCKPEAYAVYTTDSYGCSACTCQPRPTTTVAPTTTVYTTTARTTAAPVSSTQAAGCPQFRDCNCKPGSYASYFRDSNNCAACACMPGNSVPVTTTQAPTTTTQAPAPTTTPFSGCVVRTCNCKPGAGAVWSLDSNNCRTCSCQAL